MPDRIRWTEGYEMAWTGFAACRFVERLGSHVVAPEAERVRSLHDDYCRANTGLPLA